MRIALAPQWSVLIVWYPFHVEVPVSGKPEQSKVLTLDYSPLYGVCPLRLSTKA